ncbi:MAG: glycosyltransferase family 4 protein [Chloroflexota bacterium]
MVRVLTIAHNAVAASNRRRCEALAAYPDLDITLLTPPWWREEGRRIDVTLSAHWSVGRTLMTGNGTRHVYVSGLVNALRRTRPDVIDLYEEPFSLVAAQTLLLRDLLLPRAALVFYSAVNVLRTWRWPYRAIERLVLGRADGAHGPNADVPRILRAKGFSEAKPAHVIPLAVDVAAFGAATASALQGVGRPRIGFVGRLEPVKGLDVLLEAMAHHVRQPGARLVIAGNGSERERLLERARSQNGRVHIRPPVTYEHMPAFLKSLDVLVLPSVTILPLHREQFGRVLVEAMAAGVPVVGSSSGAIPEVIGDAGLVVPEGDATALGRALDRVLSEPSLRRHLIERGRQRAESQFSWPRVAEQTRDLFECALAVRRGTHAETTAVGV